MNSHVSVHSDSMNLNSQYDSMIVISYEVDTPQKKNNANLLLIFIYPLRLQEEETLLREARHVPIPDFAILI